MSFFDYYADALEIMDAGPETEGLGSLSANNGINANTTVGYNLPLSNTNAGGVTVDANGKMVIGVPDYSFVRGAVPGTYNPDRRPGSRGQRYFTDFAYTSPGMEEQAKNILTPQAAQLAAMNTANAMGYPGTYSSPSPTGMTMGNDGSGPASGVIDLNPVPTNNGGTVGGGNTGFTGGVASSQFKYGGGIAALAGGGAASAYNRRYHPYSAGGSTGRGYYLGGSTDGMADKIPATIDGTQEARLSDGEFVIPADVVSHLGNGNSSAGANTLYGMMDKVRQARTGNKEQGKEINPNKFIPSR
jgi:hypothetical protein